MSFNDFMYKFNLKKGATTKMKIQSSLSSLALTDVGTYSRDGRFKTDIEIVKINPTKATHSVLSNIQN